MTSTPVSLNAESLNGSWIDINSASQIHSPIDNDSPEYQKPPHSLSGSVQNYGIISFQVERFLQEAQKHNYNISNNNNGTQHPIVDNISDMYLSDSDLSIDGLQGGESLIDSLKKNHKRQCLAPSSFENNYNLLNQMSPELLGERLSKSGECLLDQVSDSLSILSRASFMADTGCHNRFDIDAEDAQYQNFDWMWDWTAEPEYFAGQEWKACAQPQQEASSNQQEGYYTSLNGNHHHNDKQLSGEMMSLFFLTNILSIIIGAGLTYSILMRRPTV